MRLFAICFSLAAALAALFPQERTTLGVEHDSAA